jgi:uncharacterized protein (DUF1015 family)
MSFEKQVVPFAGLRYNTGVAGRHEDLLAPPYDVIYPDMQEDLYNKSPYNIVRLILGKTAESDTETNNRYTRSAADLAVWLKNKVLVRDLTPAIYVYSQTYNTPAGEKTRTGFIARKKLEDFGGSVVPHENTFAGPKADRLNLTRACKCNFSPIFGLYTDPSMTVEDVLKEVVKEKPEVEAKMDDGQTHKFWLLTDKTKIDVITNALEHQKILIADGHHRYETALNYLKENTKNGSAPENLKYVLMYFTNTLAEGLSVFPTHRVINHLEGFDLPKILEKISVEFDVEKLVSGAATRNPEAEHKMEALMTETQTPAFGLYCGNGDYRVLRMKKSPVGGPLERLDVAILHDKILNGILGVKPQTDMANQKIYYGQDVAKCAGRVDTGISKLAFFLNATPIKQMSEVSLAGLKMPQKSTYFYPKLTTGLVVNPLY